MSHPMGSNPTNRQRLAVVYLANAIVDSVRESDNGLGVPAGPMYAALMAHGCTLNQFEQIMSGLVRVGRLTRTGNLYRAV
jgi:hypothetical protein